MRAYPTLSSLLMLAASLNAAPKVLQNSFIKASFDGNGLASIEDAATHATYPFKKDSFSIVVDGRTLSPAVLGAPAINRETDALVYRYENDGYTISCVYELQPQWRFVSKQVSVVKAAAPQFRVNAISVVDFELENAPVETRVAKSSHPELKTGDYGIFLRFAGSNGLLAAVQNPFLQVSSNERSLQIRYEADMQWSMSDGPFASDRALLLPYKLTSVRLPAAMTKEWKMPAEERRDGFDRAEIGAFQDAVRAFLLDQKRKPVRVFVGWCVNDYQIDVATPQGQSEYKRVIDRAAEMGAEYVLYAPANSLLSRREDSVDSWKWEYVLWLGLGQQIREGKWDIGASPLPPSITEMLGYSRGKKVKLLAYVYPVLPFGAHPEWIVESGKGKTANLGFRGFQDWLIDQLVAFHNRTGIGGYSFDYTFLNFPGTSRYAQWYGWRRVLETLRKRIPDIVIDGRQAYQYYGPWGWLGGSYPHPTSTDEQPESFTNFPDLHFDRVSADRERYTAYWYRNFEFTPTEVLPGYMTHQTPRSDATGQMPLADAASPNGALKPFRERDWDFLGWRYSVISSIAVAGWNSVIDMIPARDLEEYRHFSKEDIAWFRQWLDFAGLNKELLRKTRTVLGPPSIGRVDGTAAIDKDHGYVFLFNPNARRLTAEFKLDADLGLEPGTQFVLRELAPQQGSNVGKPGEGIWSYGDSVSLPIDGTTAIVLEILRAKGDEPLLFGVAGNARLTGTVLDLTDLQGEAGTEKSVLVTLPKGRRLSNLRVNGTPWQFEQTGSVVELKARFRGKRFSHSEQIGAYMPSFTGGNLQAEVTIPSRIFTQLADRRKSWPIPWTQADRETPWLVPERLLLFVQFAEPEDTWDVRLEIDGRSVPLVRAYSSLHPFKAAFCGFYADVTDLAPDTVHQILLHMPELKPGQFQGAFFDNVETEYTTDILAGSQGFLKTEPFRKTEPWPHWDLLNTKTLPRK